MQEVLYMLLGSLFWGLLTRWLGPTAVATIKKRAAQIMGDPTDPITTPKEAVDKAIIEWRYSRGDIHDAITELEQAQREGEIVARAAREQDERAAANPAPNVELVARDGSEEFRSPWKEKP